MKKILMILLIIWMGFTFSMSCENGEKSSNTSGKTIEKALKVVPELDKKTEQEKKTIVEELQFIVRKSAHFFAYMVMGILSSSLILQYENINKKFLLSWGICILYAISDEIHQLFVPGRTGQIKDVLIDSSGSLLGISIVMIIVTIFKTISIKKYL